MLAVLNQFLLFILAAYLRFAVSEKSRGEPCNPLLQQLNVTERHVSHTGFRGMRVCAARFASRAGESSYPGDAGQHRAPALQASQPGVLFLIREQAGETCGVQALG
jgi:hypothetical protein